MQSGFEITDSEIDENDPITYSNNPQNISFCIRPQWIGDGECDTVCNTPWCDFDDGDCDGIEEPLETKLPNCPGEAWVGNGKCDDEVNIPECNYDGGIFFLKRLS